MFKSWFKERLKVSRVPSAGEERALFSENLEKVYKLYGICAHLCSNVEYGMALLLHPIKWKKHSPVLEGMAQAAGQTQGIEEQIDAMKKFDESLEDVAQEIDNLSKHTLGKLINQIKENYPLNEQQEEYFKGILDKRNHLIHHIWGKYGIRLKNPDEAAKMLSELEALEKFFRPASAWIWEQARISNGIPSFMDIG